MKKFIKLFFIGSLSIMSIVSVINWYVDPMWIFNHPQPTISIKEVFDERQQKTNLLYFRSFDYEGVMLGSSKMTIVDQTKIKKHKIFNYAVNAMNLEEFNNFIEYAKKKNKKPFKVIILGMDLCSIEKPQDDNVYDFKKLIETTEDPFYKTKMLLSTDILSFSKTNVYFNLKESAYSHHFKIYGNQFIAYSIKKDPVLVKHKVDTYPKPKKGIEYNRDWYLNNLKKLKANNPDTNFIILTTPPTAPWFNTLMLQEHTSESYRLWLKDMIEVFGHIYHFAYINAVTKDYPHTYVDPGHYSSDIGELMLNKIFNQPTHEKFSKYIDDFGLVLTKDNFDLNIDKFITDAKQYKIEN